MSGGGERGDNALYSRMPYLSSQFGVLDISPSAVKSGSAGMGRCPGLSLSSRMVAGVRLRPGMFTITYSLPV
jgi:hypothetical protein